MKNERGEISITVGTLLLIIIILICVIVGLVVYKSDDKENNTDVEENYYQENEVEEENSDDSLSNEILNTTADVENNTIEQDNIDLDNEDDFAFSDEVLKETLQNYLELTFDSECSPVNLLVKLNLTTAEKIEKYEITSDNYIKTDVDYSDFQNEMLNYMTEDCFNNSFKDYKYKNDEVVYCHNGHTLGVDFEIKSIDRKNNQPNVFIAHIESLENGEYENVDLEFHVEKNENGKCVISSCSLK